MDELRGESIRDAHIVMCPLRWYWQCVFETIATMEAEFRATKAELRTTNAELCAYSGTEGVAKHY